jgi:5-methylcytosine-specific restriction endonuclease McrA
MRRPRGRYSLIWSRCLDQDDCFSYQQAQRAKRQRRTGLFVLERPKAPDAKPPLCKWCGETIVLADSSDYRRRGRNYHRGDEHEVGDVSCIAKYRASRTYDPREAVVDRDLREHGAVFCVDCGVVCVEKAEDDHPWARFGRHELERWECDHDTPLEDGGAHELDNLRCRCVPCHRRKTAHENAARRQRRRDGA